MYWRFAPGLAQLPRTTNSITTTILTLETPKGSIDLLVDPDGAARYEEMRELADVVDLDGIEFRVVSVEDLLSMKRAAGRPQDVADIDALLTVQRVRRQS